MLPGRDLRPQPLPHMPGCAVSRDARGSAGGTGRQRPVHTRRVCHDWARILTGNRPHRRAPLGWGVLVVSVSHNVEVKTMTRTIIGDIDGVAVLTSMGFLVCRECFRKRECRETFCGQIVGKSGRVVRAGDTYSDEDCDVCGYRVDRNLA